MKISRRRMMKKRKRKFINANSIILNIFFFWLNCAKIDAIFYFLFAGNCVCGQRSVYMPIKITWNFLFNWFSILECSAILFVVVRIEEM